jgi:hypothetical protein
MVKTGNHNDIVRVTSKTALARNPQISLRYAL